MAGNIWIVGRVVDAGRDSQQPPTIVSFTVTFMVTGASQYSQLQGEMVTLVDITQNETQVVLAMKTALAAYVNGLVPLGLVAGDVMGCNI